MMHLRQYPVDRRRVFLLGFSMGTVMSYALSLTQPDIFRGVVANSGYIPEETRLEFRWKELGSVDFCITHGTLDSVVPVALARRAKTLFESSGARFVYKEYPMAHADKPGEPRRHSGLAPPTHRCITMRN